MILYCFLCFIFYVEAGVFNRYYPNPRIGSGNEYQPPKTFVDKSDFKKVDCVASYGFSPEMKTMAEKSIIDHYSGIVANSGIESNNIATDMENKYGGFWMIGIFSADLDVAYTITRRSRNYGVFTIDDKMILVAKDGNTEFNEGPVY
ncbi:hypothetical protein FO519_002017 [Halicephalobus sp. NKZ332]|nr:hypothetical protein FO519_002017 [Halicephalobus sp. NKZ332]